MQTEIIKLKIEKLKLELNYYWYIICNVLWIVSIFAAFVITAILVGFNFYIAILIFSLFSLILAIAVLPISKRYSYIKKIEFQKIDEDIKKLKK